MKKIILFLLLVSLCRNITLNAQEINHFNIGQKYFREKNYQAASEEFRKALAVTPANTLIHYHLALSLYFLNSSEEAKTSFTAVLEREDKNWRNISSSAYYITILEDNVNPHIESLKNKNPLAADMLQTYKMFNAGEYAGGFEVISRVEKEKKTNGEIAFDIMSKIIQKCPAPENLHLLFIKNYPASERIEWMGNRILTFIRNTGEKQALKNKIIPALEEIIAGIQDNARLPLMEKMLVDVRFEGLDETEELYLEKVEEYSGIITKYPESEATKSILFEIGKICVDRIEKYDKAIIIFKELQEKKNYRNSTVELAKAYVKKNDYDSAVNILKESLSKQPQNETAQLFLGETLLESHETDKGMEVLQALEKATKNSNVQTRILNIKNDYREIAGEEKMQMQMPFVIAKILHAENFFSNLVNIDSCSPVLHQKTKGLQVYLFDAKKMPVSFTAGLTSEEKPSLADPYVIYRQENEGYTTKWSVETFMQPDRWRKVSPLTIIFPWAEKIQKEVTIIRNNHVGDEKLHVEIEIVLPDENWEIQIVNPARGGKIIDTRPAPDIRNNLFVFQAAGLKNLKVEVSYPFNPDILQYYPEVVAVKREEKSSSVVNPADKKIVHGNFYMETDVPVKTAVFICEEEQVFRLAERMKRK